MMVEKLHIVLDILNNWLELEIFGKEEDQSTGAGRRANEEKLFEGSALKSLLLFSIWLLFIQ